MRLFKPHCKKERRVMAQKNYSLAHTKWMCKYHIVFTPKYRRKIIYNKYRKESAGIHKNTMQVQGSGDTGRAYDAGPCTPAGSDPAENKCIKFHGVPQGKECTDDV